MTKGFQVDLKRKQEDSLKNKIQIKFNDGDNYQSHKYPYLTIYGLSFIFSLWICLLHYLNMFRGSLVYNLE